MGALPDLKKDRAHTSSDSIHLKQCVTLYLFCLPAALVHDLGWLTVPVVTCVAFTFMGIEGIADEIEMPFGMSFVKCSISATDYTQERMGETFLSVRIAAIRSLPLTPALDRYCQDLKDEIKYVWFPRPARCLS